MRDQLAELARRLSPELMKAEADDKNMHYLKAERDRRWAEYEASALKVLAAQKAATAKGQDPQKDSAVMHAMAEEDLAQTALSNAAAAVTQEFAAGAARTTSTKEDLERITELYREAIRSNQINPFDSSDPLTTEVLPFVGTALPPIFNPNT